MCQNGKRYLVTHQLRVSSNITTVNLDAFPGLESVTCDFGRASLLLAFPDDTYPMPLRLSTQSLNMSSKLSHITSVFSNCVEGEQNIRRGISAVKTGSSVELSCTL